MRLSAACACVWTMQEGQHGRTVLWKGELPAEARILSAEELRRGVPGWRHVFSAAPAEGSAPAPSPEQARARLHPVSAVLGGCAGEDPALLQELDAACRASSATALANGWVHGGAMPCTECGTAFPS